MSRRWGQLCLAVVASVALVLGSSGVAAAECEWSASDPYFSIDGRVVRVLAYVPVAHKDAVLDYVMIVGADSRATWWLPPGEDLRGGSVSIERSGDDGDEAKVIVTARGATVHQMKLSISGTGLDGPAFDRFGTSKKTQAKIKLVDSAR